MDGYMTIQIDRDDFVDMLTERVRFWTDEEDVIELYHDLYEYYVDIGTFDGTKETVQEIVDNDWVNWTEVVSKEDEEWEDILSIYHADDYKCKYQGGTASIEILDEEKEMAIIRW